MSAYIRITGPQITAGHQPQQAPPAPGAYRELLVCLVPNRPGEDPDDHEHDFSIPCRWVWICNTCSTRVDDEPCPDHAPLTPPPGMRLVDCAAEPRHWLFSHDREDYGHPCPACAYHREHEDLTPYKLAAERREHRWCWLLNPLKRAAIRLRIARYRGGPWTHACFHVDARWRWPR